MICLLAINYVLGKRFVPAYFVVKYLTTKTIVVVVDLTVSHESVLLRKIQT